MDSASSQRSIWLPPINSHPVFRIIVKATGLEPASDPFDPEDDAPTFLHLQLKQQTQRYMKEYYFAISRPRTENELMDELMTYSNKARTASRTSIDDALQDIVLLNDDEGESSSCCLVCLQEFSVGSNLKMMPCNHVFHPDCIVQWWLEKGSHKCPLCRDELRFA